MKLVCAVSINTKISFFACYCQNIYLKSFPLNLETPIKWSYNGNFVLKNVSNYEFEKDNYYIRLIRFNGLTHLRSNNYYHPNNDNNFRTAF